MKYNIVLFNVPLKIPRKQEDLKFKMIVSGNISLSLEREGLTRSAQNL